jgi:hypothetical protein
MGKQGNHRVTENERHLCQMLAQAKERAADLEKQRDFAVRRECHAQDYIKRLQYENEQLTKQVAELKKSACDWERAKAHLYEISYAYTSIERPGMVGLMWGIDPVRKRFEAGERTPELFEAIMALE